MAGEFDIRDGVSGRGRVQPPSRPEPLQPVRSDQVTPEAAARLPRQTSTETRADLIEAAERIVNEYVKDGPRQGDPPVDLLPFLQLDEVLTMATELARLRLVKAGRMRPGERVAPLTPGAFYKAFANDDRDAGRGGAIVAFRRLVTLDIVNRPDITIAEPYIALGKQLLAEGFPWTEIVRQGIELDFNRWADTPALILMSALALHSRDPDVAKMTDERDEQDLAELTRIYETLLPMCGRRMRPGFTIAHLATVVSDLIAGMVLGARFSSERRRTKIVSDFDGTGAKEWHLAACAALAICERFTEPDDGGGGSQQK
jgi:hypothetical protein